MGVAAALCGCVCFVVRLLYCLFSCSLPLALADYFDKARISVPQIHSTEIIARK